jgi:hypothetical protein
MSKRVALAIAIVTVCAFHHSARAQHAAPFQQERMLPARDFGAELHLGSMDFAFNSLTVIGIETFGQIPLTSRLGLRGRLPIAHANGSGDSGTSLGNLTVGLEYLVRGSIGPRSADAVSVGGSLSLPTASDTGDSGAAASALATYRVPFPGYYAPNTTTLRAHVSWRKEQDRWLVQLQPGIHVLAVEGTNNDQTLLRFNIAGGWHASPNVVLMGELSTVSRILDDNAGEEWLHTLDLGMRYFARRSVFGVRLYYPLDESRREGLDMIGIAADLTARY